jgi:predicted secreted acid phosphatase
MAIKSAWAYRNGKRMMREVNQFVTNMDTEKKAKHNDALPELLKKRELLRKAKELRENAMFESLKVGDTLEVFGMPHILIKKKNRKSIITSTDNKFLKSEILGANLKPNARLT